MSRPTFSRPSRDERGAVAIMVAILSALLLIAGALAVDLGNAWARQRDMQTQADVAALSAGNWGRDQPSVMWPADKPEEREAITREAAEYIVEENNNAIGMTKTTATDVYTALTDADKTNGHVEWLKDYKQMRLTPPPATVNFGMAAVFGYGSVDVSAPATVEVKSELPSADVVPLWIPDNCSFGAVQADTTGGLKGGGTGAGTGKNKTADFLLVGEASPPSVAKGSTATINLIVTSNPALDLDASIPPVVSFELKIGSETWKYDIPGSWTDTPNGNQQWKLKVDLDNTNVTSVAGPWSYQVSANNGAVNTDVKTFAVTGTNPAPATTGCIAPDRGNFGQLDSPRTGFPANDTGKRGERLFANMLNGLDHQLVPHPNATQPTCESPTLPNSQHDDVVRPGNNCIIGDSGNDGPQFAEALVGSSSTVGRLDVSKGATYSGATSGCPGRPDLPVGLKTLNNDIIDCYLMKRADGTRYSALDITQPTATRDMLDPKIVNSPRFVWIPVVKATDRSVKTFQPIIKFVPGLITSQNLTAPTASADAFDAAYDFKNGIQCNGASGNCNSLSAIRIFTFNPRAVPNLPDSPVIDYNPTIGREAIRLVE